MFPERKSNCCSMARFVASQKAFRPVDRPATTVWYGKKERGFDPSRRRRRSMTDKKSSDPVALWQAMIGEMEKGFNAFANRAMTSPEFSKAMNQAGGVTAGAQQQFGELMEKYLLSMNMPSRAQMIGMA